MVEPEEWVASRGKTLGYLAICAGFVAVALFLPHDGKGEGWRWLCLLFFGLGCIVLAVTLVRPQRLMLDAEGFTIAGGLARSSRRRGWCDVERFHLFRLPRGGTMVGYDLADHARRDSYLGDLQRRWAPDGVLPKTLPGSPESIAAALNAYRDRALAGSPPVRRRTVDGAG